MSWTTIRADEYCESVRDGTHDTPKQTETGYKLVTGKHIKNGQIDPSEAYCISEKDYKKINERSLVEQWDVLMSMIGTVGEVAVVKDHPKQSYQYLHYIGRLYRVLCPLQGFYWYHNLQIPGFLFWMI